MVLYWAQDVLLAIWTVAFVCSRLFYESFARRSLPPAGSAVPPHRDRDEIGELPSLLARALEQVEDQTYLQARNHLKQPDPRVAPSRT
jgi:hypothetical protein